MSTSKTTLEDLMGIEHSKLNFFQELRQTIEKLTASHRESEDQRMEIAAILEGITDLMMVLSEDLRIISVNHVFLEMFPGTKPIGKHCHEIFRDSEFPCAECPALRSLKSDEVCRDTAIFRMGERNRQFQMVAAPLKNTHLPQHRVLIFKRDVTMEKQYQAKFYQAEKMATIGMLAAGVAHEVNNPLTAVSGFAEGIKRRLPRLENRVEDDLYEEFKEYTDTILKECERCQKIVQTLLTFSRPVVSDFTQVSINQVVKDTVRILQHHFKRHPRLKVSLSLAEVLPMVRGDEAQLKQVALNLLTNAVDAIGEEGELCVSTVIYNGGVRMSVSDSGCGIPETNLDKLFDPFFTTKPVGKGIGIGLATCYHIVQDHGGDISVNSEPGTGTCFSVTLPINSRG